MKVITRFLVVGVFAAALTLLGIGVASAQAAPTVATAAAPAASHAGLQCRNHAAESKPVKGKVVVPSNYCYDPDTTNHRGWHDYCTSSPDSVYAGTGVVDFRGPCARHDMCLQASRSHSKCDGPLYNDMIKNCDQRFAWYNPSRAVCHRVAATYYAVIKVKTLVS